MDVATIDNEFQQLQTQANQAVQAVQGLAQKLQGAAAAGDANAREWLLDLREVAMQIQQEQLQTQALLQALHGFAVNQMQQQAPQPVYVQQPMPQQVVYEQAQPQGGGVLHHFMGSGFGQAMTQGVGMGAGFGIADSLINSIFG